MKPKVCATNGSMFGWLVGCALKKKYPNQWTPL